MRVLLVGGTGLIGTALAHELVRRGHEVTAVQRGRRERRGPAGLRYLTVDRRDRPAFEAAVAREAFDVVFDMIAFEVEDVRSALRAFGGRVGRYVFCSTVCVYGGPLGALPAGEDTPRRPVSAYGRGKVECEDELLRAHEADGFPVVLLRPGYVYGEGGTFLSSVGWRTTFLDRLRLGRPVVVHGDGQSLFSACFAGDVAQAFAAAVDAPGVEGRAFNLAADTDGTFLDYVRGLAEAMGGRCEPRFVATDLLARVAPERARSTVEVFRYNMRYDLRRARAELGFAPVTSLADGARRCVAWLARHGRLEPWTADPFEEALVSAIDAQAATFPREEPPC